MHMKNEFRCFLEQNAYGSGDQPPECGQGPIYVETSQVERTISQPGSSPWPWSFWLQDSRADAFGISTARKILRVSLDVRHWSCNLNQVQASYLSNTYPLVVGDGEGRNFQHVAYDPTGSLWFQRFALGCSQRMGKDWWPDMAVSPNLI